MVGSAGQQVCSLLNNTCEVGKAQVMTSFTRFRNIWKLFDYTLEILVVFLFSQLKNAKNKKNFLMFHIGSSP